METNNQPEVNIMDYIYPKKFECPVCGAAFEDYTVKRSKLRTRSRDTDLRTRYYYIDPGLYDVVLCNKCGYAALSAYFDRITDKQKDMINDSIRPEYQSVTYTAPLSAEQGLRRYEQTLSCAEAIHAKASVRAIICLKMAWIYRDMGDMGGEMQHLHLALSGLKDAYSNEPFPLAGLDEYSAQLTIAELSRRVGESNEALRWISALINAKGIPSAIKERAIDVKDLIREGHA